jgi:hypothetical protein
VKTGQNLPFPDGYRRAETQLIAVRIADAVDSHTKERWPKWPHWGLLCCQDPYWLIESCGPAHPFTCAEGASVKIVIDKPHYGRSAISDPLIEKMATHLSGEWPICENLTRS